MKVDIKGRPKRIFEELEIGDCFVRNDFLYMKIQSISDNAFAGRISNAIVIQTEGLAGGHLVRFEPGQHVLKVVDIELTGRVE